MRQLFLIVFAACTACSASGPVAPPAEDAPALLTRMRAMAGSAACTESAQCRTVAIGARPCGGPEAYLPYSVAATPAEPLLALARRHAELRRAENARSGMASDCRFLPDPGATCRAGSCQPSIGAPDPT